MQGMVSQVEIHTATMLSHYFLIKRLLNMNISYRDIVEMITEKDINYLLAIEQASDEIEREHNEQAHSISKLHQK